MANNFYQEACELVPMCLEFIARLAENEATFVNDLANKLEQYKERIFLSEKQMNWLRAIALKAPDPRQSRLF